MMMPPFRRGEPKALTKLRLERKELTRKRNEHRKYRDNALNHINHIGRQIELKFKGSVAASVRKDLYKHMKFVQKRVSELDRQIAALDQELRSIEQRASQFHSQ